MSSLRIIIEAGKLIGAAIGGIVAIGTVYSGIVTISGGRLIPWESHDEIKNMIDKRIKMTEIRFDASFKTIINYDNEMQCQDYSDRLSRALMALTRNSRDQVAMDLRNASLEKIATIPNCRV